MSTYQYGCDESQEFNCVDCISSPLDGVYAFGIFKASSNLNVENANDWIAKENDGEAIRIPYCQGTWNENPKTEAGFGRVLEQVVSVEGVAELDIPVNILNDDFWNEKMKSSQWRAAIIKDGSMIVTDNVVMIMKANNVTADKTARTKDHVTIKCVQQSGYKRYEVPALIFDGCDNEA